MELSNWHYLLALIFEFPLAFLIFSPSPPQNKIIRQKQIRRTELENRRAWHV